MTALQVLGVALVELPKDALAKIALPEDLADAIREARRITDHEGRRRQLQYVGRLMRGLPDDAVAGLRSALDALHGANKAETAKLHAFERWRERLLADDDALTEFVRRYPGVDAQHGRTLIRNARREASQQKPPRYFRELFQWVKDAVAGATPAAPAGVDAGGDDDGGDYE